jgi:ATP-dependent RNA helicase DeaD
LTTFEQLGLNAPLLKALKEIGFETPTPIQDKVIPHLLNEAGDLVALAQTGTGKTAAFGLPILHKIDTKKRYPQALILSPTRELCLQIADDLLEFAKYMPDVHILPVYGGAGIDSQMKALRAGVHIVVATPGRLVDLLNRRSANLDKVETVVLDEADEMLDMGFTESLNAILATVPTERQTLLFSATMSSEISKIAKKYMGSFSEIAVGNKNEGNENIKHVAYMVQARDKFLALKRLADYYPNIYGIVFCRTRRDTQEIADKLIAEGYNADALHGDLSQSQRDHVMGRFRAKHTQLLVATDVAARGIDVDSLTHVIHFSLPDEISSYTHRSGRTGRAGKTGISMAIVHSKEKNAIRQIEKIINKTFIWEKVPGGPEICEKQLFHYLDRLERVDVEQKDIAPFIDQVYRKIEWMDREELINRVVSLEFNDFLQYYRGAKDINAMEKIEKKDFSREGKSEYGSRRESVGKEPGFTCMFMNMGKLDGLHPAMLMEMIRAQTGSNRTNFGKIAIMKRHTLIDIDDSSVRDVLGGFQNFTYDGRRISIKVDGDSNGPSKSPSGRSYSNDRNSAPRSDKPSFFGKGPREKKGFGKGKR